MPAASAHAYSFPSGRHRYKGAEALASYAPLHTIRKPQVKGCESGHHARCERTRSLMSFQAAAGTRVLKRCGHVLPCTA